MTDLSVRQAAGQAVARLRAMWPAFNWGEPGATVSAARDYGEGLAAMGDADAITRGITRALRVEGGRFPPPLADLLVYVRAELPARAVSMPDNPPNRCPVCQSAGDRSRKAVVDENGMASCTDGTHRHVWRAT